MQEMWPRSDRKVLELALMEAPPNIALERTRWVKQWFMRGLLLTGGTCLAQLGRVAQLGR